MQIYKNSNGQTIIDGNVLPGGSYELLSNPVAKTFDLVNVHTGVFRINKLPFGRIVDETNSNFATFEDAKNHLLLSINFKVGGSGGITATSQDNRIFDSEAERDAYWTGTDQGQADPRYTTLQNGHIIAIRITDGISWQEWQGGDLPVSYDNINWNTITNTVEFLKAKGDITVAADFPAPVDVDVNDVYFVKADVTDNDPAKTNTGLSFVTDDEICWTGSTWILLGHKYIDFYKPNNSVNINTSTVNPDPYKNLLVDSSVTSVDLEFPAVVAGDVRWYRITLDKNGNHCNLSVTGGVQEIGGKTIQSISTEKASVLIVANGVDGYYLLEDTREYKRLNRVDVDLDLTNGFASGGFYGGHPADGTQVTITLENWNLVHAGDYATFYKAEGENATVRVKSQDSTFDETIFNIGEAFTVMYGGEGYEIIQDSRTKPSEVTLNLFPTDVSATSVPAYNLLVTNTTDPDYPDPAVTFSTQAITSLTGESAGFFTTNSPVLSGLLQDKNIVALAKIKKQTATLANIKFKFKYYSYDIATTTLESVLLETTFSEIVDTTDFVEKQVSGILPQFNWDGKLLVIELIVARTTASGLEPILDFEFGGLTPSKTSIDVAATQITHDSLSNVDLAGTGVSFGHISDTTQTIAGEKTFTNSPKVPTPTDPTDAANKSFVEGFASGGFIPIYKQFWNSTLNIVTSNLLNEDLNRNNMFLLQNTTKTITKVTIWCRDVGTNPNGCKVNLTINGNKVLNTDITVATGFVSSTDFTVNNTLNYQDEVKWEVITASGNNDISDGLVILEF